MLAEISGGLSSLKAAFDIAKGLNAFENAAALNEVKLTLQNNILEAQQALFAAQQAEAATANRIAQLEAEIMRMKDWSAERERYELAYTGPRDGSLVYMLKPEMRGTEPAHWLCTCCFEAGKKSILQKKGSDGNFATYACPFCKSTLATHWSRTPAYRDTPEG
ncbi:MAG: hypothetical protein EON59_09875 [Alphaproteobacteria bacterium]|nr:MAG: hypothetical protein EON59_09875 [Alphaproteobacteria bacterium]